MAAIAIALVLMIFLIWLAFWWMNRNSKNFDERQIEIQRKAYQIGFFIEITYLLCLFTYGTIIGNPPVEWTLLIMLGIGLPLIPVVTCMVWKDAYLKPGQSYLFFGIAGVIIGVMNLFSTASLYRTAPMGETEKLWTPLMPGIAWLWIGLLIIIKHFINKHLDKEV